MGRLGKTIAIVCCMVLLIQLTPMAQAGTTAETTTVNKLEITAGNANVELILALQTAHFLSANNVGRPARKNST